MSQKTDLLLPKADGYTIVMTGLWDGVEVTDLLPRAVWPGSQEGPSVEVALGLEDVNQVREKTKKQHTY